MGSAMPTLLRPARADDFDFCTRLYFSGMAETIQLLNLDMAAQTRSLRERWDAGEVQIITCDDADIGWMQSSIQVGGPYLEQIFVDAAFRRRGIGTEVIVGLIDNASRAGQPV